jgi:DNA processing protein
LVATRQTEAHARHPQVLVALGHDPLDLDTLQRRTGLNTADLSIALTELELDGRIAVLPDGRFQRLDTN